MPRTDPMSDNFTMTGRIRAWQPRFHNLPLRTPEGRRISEAFRGEATILAIDYATIEMRVLDPRAHHRGQTDEQG